MRVISFDVWGTLVSLKKMLSYIVEEVASLSGLSASQVESAFKEARRRAKELRYAGKLPAREAVFICQELFAEVLGVDVDVVRRACARAVIVADESMVLPGVLKVLSRLSADFKLVCVGNVQFWPSAQTRILLERFGISQFLKRHFFSDEVGVFKPDKAIFREVAVRMGVAEKEILHVGDRAKEDFEGARAAGCKAYLVKEGVPLDEQLLEFLDEMGRGD